MKFTSWGAGRKGKKKRRGPSSYTKKSRVKTEPRHLFSTAEGKCARDVIVQVKKVYEDAAGVKGKNLNHEKSLFTRPSSGATIKKRGKTLN